MIFFTALNKDALPLEVIKEAKVAVIDENKWYEAKLVDEVLTWVPSKKIG